jgi:hypothetical protein
MRESNQYLKKFWVKILALGSESVFESESEKNKFGFTTLPQGSKPTVFVELSKRFAVLER